MAASLSYNLNNVYHYIIHKSAIPEDQHKKIIAEHKRLVASGMTSEEARHHIQFRVNNERSKLERGLPYHMFFSNHHNMYVLEKKVDGKVVREWFSTKKAALAHYESFIGRPYK